MIPFFQKTYSGLREDALFKRVVRNSTYLFSSNVLSATLGFVQGILATRLVVMSPSPGRISHVYDDVPFSRQFLAHGDARKVKSEPAFIQLREEVLAIVHRRSPSGEVAHA